MLRRSVLARRFCAASLPLIPDRRRMVLMPIDLVTGGAGFIGSHLVDALLAAGRAVRVLDNFSTGCPDNLAAVRGRVEVLDGDITDAETVRRALRGVEVVFHQAALASVPRSVADPLATH